ncbi:MAG: TfoX/Sxy family protein [Methanosphaera stadtmanae]|jgi:DNA transformation protein|nr:TfoX/Sxy family protein [Methanosphaera stadtmanae]
MGELSRLPNIGKVIEGQLNDAGIYTVDELMDLGSIEAWLKIRDVDESACIHRLRALEGAIQNIRKQDLSDDKNNLRDFYNNFKK